MFNKFDPAMFEDMVDACAAPTPDFYLSEELMNKLVKRRINKKKNKEAIGKGKTVRFPVALFFVRGDRGGDANAIADEAISSMKYWNLHSADYIDILFAGWTKDGFDTELFFTYQQDIESICKWQYNGESEILLINFDFDTTSSTGKFAFDEVVSLPIEEMIKKDITSSVDALINEIVLVSKHIDGGSVWEISDRFAIQRGRQSLWSYIKNKVTGGLSEVYDELKPFSVCNLEKNTLRDFDRFKADI